MLAGFPKTIKIGANQVLIKEHADTETSGAIFNWQIPEITLMSRNGSFSNIHDIYLLDRFMCVLLKAICHYSGVQDYGWENRVRAGQGILQAIRSNIRQNETDGKNVINVAGVFDPPESIDLCSYRIKIVVKDADHRIEQRCSAHCDIKEEMIAVFRYFENCKIEDHASLWQSLWHEIFHAIFRAFSMDYQCDDEKLVDSHAQWWVMVLYDNPELVEYLKRFDWDNKGCSKETKQ